MNPTLHNAERASIIARAQGWARYRGMDNEEIAEMVAEIEWADDPKGVAERWLHR